MRTAATRSSRARSSTALVAWVVPSMTWPMRSRSTPGSASTASRAAVMPPVTSAVVGRLALGDQPAGGVEDDGVGVRAADVDAEPQVGRAAHAASSSTGT